MAYSSFEGYDNESNRQSGKEEKWERSTRAAKWIVLSLIIGGSLIFAVKLCVQDTMLKMNGNSIVTEFKNGTTLNGTNGDGYETTVDYKNKTTVKFVFPHYNNDGQVSIGLNTQEYGKNCITAFVDDNGIIHIVPIIFTMLSPFNVEKVTVYYYGDDVGSAKALNSIWFWIVFYIVLIPLLYLCMRAAYRITYPKSHVRAEVEEEHKTLKNRIVEIRKRKI